MSNYTKTVNFATKDNLNSGNPLKIVKGTEIDTEYNNIATAVATKTDNSAAAITGGAIDGATVGSTTPAAGAFTTLAASGTTTLAGALVGAATQAAFNTTTTTLNLGGAATVVNLGAATGTATVNNTTLAAKAITASTTLAVTGTSTLTGAVTATAGVTGPITSSNVAITGGTITGITDLAVADGGTGASTAAGALNNLLPSQTSNANKYLQTDGTNASWDAVSLSTADITGTLAVANGGTGVTSSTGTGNVVLSNSPTLVTPALGTPASGTATNLTGLPISTGVSGLGTGVATFLATPSSANLISAVTDETGSGALVFANSPTLVTPALGTPSALVGTNITGTASGLTAGNVTTNANLTGAVTSVGNATSLGSFTSLQLATALTDETGSGANVFATSPTLVTPILGTPTSATLTNATGLPLSTGVTGTLPVANGGTGQTTATAAFNALAPSQTSNSGKYLTTDGTNSSWATVAASQWTTSGSNIYYNSTGSVGIGTTPNLSPGAPYNVLNLGTQGGGGITSAGTDTYLTNNIYLSGGSYFAYTGGSAYGSYYNQSGGNHVWKTSSAAGTGGNVATLNTLMTLNSNGALALFGGVSATGVGITFPATQSASSDANTLDDYEEGTWTPSVTLNSGTATAYTIGTATYTKTGRTVVVIGSIIGTNGTVGSTNGYIRMTGLPFTVATLSGAGAGGNISALNGGIAATFAYSTTVDATFTIGVASGNEFAFVATYFV